jgi:hypothetical protein
MDGIEFVRTILAASPAARRRPMSFCNILGFCLTMIALNLFLGQIKKLQGRKTLCPPRNKQEYPN